ncbi:hypothetical protein [Azospirillum sp. TSO22-1]|uniref:hypothetical protein n=1 Tax=Azospirillum sp. TSO22-1 TaxID=716789 RepID=UPI000D61BE41|nr:hypothetical protein [Azospirillum sp. TSO22-1]PWC35308.1 hypothetical protein TSO221_29985 [Azospirillum sp. TSO22-1]
MDESHVHAHLQPMTRPTTVRIGRPPPLWPSQLAHCRTLMRDFSAPAILVEGRLMETPFGPRIAATMDVPPEMGPVTLAGHPAYRLAMRDAAGMVTFARMVALNASGIDPVTASRELEDVLWQVIVLPAGVTLIARTEDADYGPFLLAEEEPDERLAALVDRQLSFAGITVGDRPAEGTDTLNRA